MTCHEFQEHLSAYLEREMESEQAARMAAHGETCARCQKERTLILTMKSVLRKREMPGIPSDLITAIQAKTRLNIRWWQTDGFRTRWVPALVGLSTAVGALWLSKAHSNPRPEHAIPVAARPLTGPVVAHARLLQNELSNQEKGESRENPKS